MILRILRQNQRISVLKRNFSGVSNSKHVFVGTDANFDELVKESQIPSEVIIDVHAEWCPPCKLLGPILEREVDKQNGKVKLVTVDSDQESNLARSLQVRVLPTVFGFYDGEVVNTFQGFPGEEKVKQYVAALAKLGEKKEK